MGRPTPQANPEDSPASASPGRVGRRRASTLGVVTEIAGPIHVRRSPLHPTVRDLRAGEPDRSVVLGNPATLAPLGIAPDTLTSLEGGMEKTIRWYRDNYDWRGVYVRAASASPVEARVMT